MKIESNQGVIKNTVTYTVRRERMGGRVERNARSMHTTALSKWIVRSLNLLSWDFMYAFVHLIVVRVCVFVYVAQ